MGRSSRVTLTAPKRPSSHLNPNRWGRRWRPSGHSERRGSARNGVLLGGLHDLWCGPAALRPVVMLRMPE